MRLGAIREQTIAAWRRIDAVYQRHPFLVVAAAMLAFAIHVSFVRHGAVGIDFEVFRKTGARLIAGEAIYQPDENMPFKYAPVFAVVFMALGVAPPLPTYWAWNILNALALAIFVSWGARSLKPEHRLLGTALAFFACASMVQHHYALGPIDCCVLAAIALSETQRTKNPVASGALLAFAALIKITFVAFIAVAFVFFARKRILGVALGLAVGLLAPTPFYGMAQTHTWTFEWLHLLGASLEPWICWRDNQGAFGIACLFGLHPASPEHMRAGYAVALLAVIPAGLVVLKKLLAKESEHARRAAVLFALFMTFFLSPLGWYTNLVAMIPLCQRAVAFAAKRPSRALFFLPILVQAFLVHDTLGEAFVGYKAARAMGFEFLWLLWVLAWFIHREGTED